MILDQMLLDYNSFTFAGITLKLLICEIRFEFKKK